MSVTISGTDGIDKVADGAEMPAGSVIQVVGFNTVSSWTTTSNSYSSTDLSQAITPKYANSKILVQIFGSVHFDASGTHGMGQIRKDGSTLSDYNDDDLLGYSSASFARSDMTSTFWFGDAGSTNTATYAYYVCTQNSALFYFYRNCGITITEIKG